MEFAVRQKHTSSPTLEFGPDEYRVDIQCNVKNRTGVLPSLTGSKAAIK